MPILVLLILGLLIWYFSKRVIASKNDDRQLIESRLCILEHEINVLKEQANILKEVARDCS
jgi:hypothetical protein